MDNLTISIYQNSYDLKPKILSTTFEGNSWFQKCADSTNRDIVCLLRAET